MEKYDYKMALRVDIKEIALSELDIEKGVEEFEDFDDFYGRLDYEVENIEQEVTGSGVGSYFPYCSRQSKECVLENLELLEEVRSEYGISHEEIGKLMLDDNFCKLDVLIRRHLFYDVLLLGMQDAWEELGGE